MKISIIVSTYNWPEALELNLSSLSQQTDKEFEVIIADDGSDNRTKQVVEKIRNNTDINLNHSWHEDKGFRAAKARNLAVSKATGEYLIFLDGDCLPRRDFVINHRRLAEKSFFVVGNRVLVSQKKSNLILLNNIKFEEQSLMRMLLSRVKGDINRFHTLINLPVRTRFRYKNKSLWKKAMTCNLAMFKNDFLDIRGFDEAYLGWGYEDSDLVVRLLNNGIYRKSGKFSTTVFHLWHKENYSNDKDKNKELLEEVITRKKIYPRLSEFL